MFDNGRKNKAYNVDIVSLNARMKPDLVYYDPPYITEFSSTDYEKRYHFIEGLMTNWKGKTINKKTVTKTYYEAGQGITKKTIKPFFNDFIKSGKTKKVILSYRDKSFPRENEIKKIFKENGYKIKKVKKIDHQYSTSVKYGDASKAKEYLYEAEK